MNGALEMIYPRYKFNYDMFFEAMRLALLLRPSNTIARLIKKSCCQVESDELVKDIFQYDISNCFVIFSCIYFNNYNISF